MKTIELRNHTTEFTIAISEFAMDIVGTTSMNIVCISDPYQSIEVTYTYVRTRVISKGT
jgi:hypothetical protein